MTKMHKEELSITTVLVKQLLRQQCPEYSKLKLTPILSSDSVHVLFRLGEKYVISCFKYLFIIW